MSKHASAMEGKPQHRILIIDDDEAICTMLRTFLESLDFAVSVCMSPLNLVRDLSNLRYDVILLDVMMSWVDGYRLLEILKNHPVTKNIPILMISARSREEDIRRGLDLKAVDYFVKPFNLSRLRGRIDELLAARN